MAVDKNGMQAAKYGLCLLLGIGALTMGVKRLESRNKREARRAAALSEARRLEAARLAEAAKRRAGVAARRVAAAKGAQHAQAAGIRWVTIPGGSFMMGSGGGAEWPAHSVTIKSFQMAKTEVTNRQYRACVDAGACTALPDVGDGLKGDDQPAINVEWEAAKVFSAWVGGRLPSEAQWEYAARSAGKHREYPWGNEAATCARAVIIEGDYGCGRTGKEFTPCVRGLVLGDGYGCGRKTTWPVCSKPSGNTEQGLCDMAGNVFEWTQDWFHPLYTGAPANGSAWESPAGSIRVIRGGSWSYGASSARSAARGISVPALRNDDVGFRPVR